MYFSYKCDEGQAPGGSTCLDSKILQYIYDLGTSTKYPFQVKLYIQLKYYRFICSFFLGLNLKIY